MSPSRLTPTRFRWFVVCAGSGPVTCGHIIADLLPTNQPDAPAKRGRPPKHANAAAKQKAYRERQKAKGFRDVKRYVRDIDAPLYSDVIDLSEVRP